jgi:hypothetical protein
MPVNRDFRVIAQRDGKIVRPYGVVQEILFYQMPFVAQAKYKAIEAISSVDLHDVPKYWPATDLDHWFRENIRLLSEPCSLPTAQYNDLHKVGSMIDTVKRLSSTIGEPSQNRQ